MLTLHCFTAVRWSTSYSTISTRLAIIYTMLDLFDKSVSCAAVASTVT